MFARKSMTIFGTSHGLRYCLLPNISSHFISCRQGLITSTSDTLRAVLSPVNQQRCKSALLSTSNRNVKPLWLKGKTLAEMRQAGVLVPLCTVNGEPSILLTLRSKNMSGYSGQVSFPGGMFDDCDKDLIDTSLRETKEEIGMERSSVDVWGRLTPLPGRGFDVAVTPVLGFCGEVDIASLKINPTEVIEVFPCSLASLCSPTNAKYTTFRGKTTYTMPVYVGEAHRIWGLSAIILHQVLTLLAPDHYKFKHLLRM